MTVVDPPSSAYAGYGLATKFGQPRIGGRDDRFASVVLIASNFRRHPDDPDAPLDHYDFAIRKEAEEAFSRIIGAIRIEEIRDQPEEELKAIA